MTLTICLAPPRPIPVFVTNDLIGTIPIPPRPISFSFENLNMVLWLEGPESCIIKVKVKSKRIKLENIYAKWRKWSTNRNRILKIHYFRFRVCTALHSKTNTLHKRIPAQTHQRSQGSWIQYTPLHQIYIDFKNSIWLHRAQDSS